MRTGIAHGPGLLARACRRQAVVYTTTLTQVCQFDAKMPIIPVNLNRKFYLPLSHPESPALQSRLPGSIGLLVSSQPKGHTIEEQGKGLHVAHLYDRCAGQFLDNELLHELRCPAVHAGSALIQADIPRTPQQDSSQAQELLLPWVQHKSNVASDIIQCLHDPCRSLSMRLITPCALS